MREYEKYWLKKGTELNHKYEILDVIDEGGMGMYIWVLIRFCSRKCQLRNIFLGVMRCA